MREKKSRREKLNWMECYPCAITDVMVITPRVISDERGFFLEFYRQDMLQTLGIQENFVQDNHSQSKQSVLRGLHYQIHHPQGKLVRVAAGEVFDVAVDLRKSSPTFGKWIGEILSEENARQLWIPPGFAHGFYVLSTQADVIYKVTDYYFPEGDRTLRWDDPELCIKWPLIDDNPPILSEKDKNGKFLSHADLFE
jgi:dTDP-4-dehydrorhamnose 3,5-epimerase